MRASIITGCLMTALAVAVSLPLTRSASAADFGGESYAEPPYDDQPEYGAEPGYDDERDAPPRRYGEAPPPGRYGDEQADEPYDDRGGPYEQQSGSIKDGYPVPVAPPRHTDRAPREQYEHHACLDRWQIRHRLRNDGWMGIRPLGGEDGIVRMRAGRVDSSTVFRLSVDRCSGEVVDARPERLRSFAFGERRWDRRW